MSLPPEAAPSLPQVSSETTACAEFEDVILEGIAQPAPEGIDISTRFKKGELARLIVRLGDAYGAEDLPLPSLSEGQGAIYAALKHNPAQTNQQLARNAGFSTSSIGRQKQRILQKLAEGLPDERRAYEFSRVADENRLTDQFPRYEIGKYKDVTEVIRAIGTLLSAKEIDARQYLTPAQQEFFEAVIQNPGMNIPALGRLLTQDSVGLSRLSHRIIGRLNPHIPVETERPKILEPSGEAREVGRTLKRIIIERALAAIATQIEVDRNALLGFLVGQETPPAEEILDPLIRLLGLPDDQAAELRAQYEEAADYSYEPWVEFLSSIEPGGQRKG